MAFEVLSNGIEYRGVPLGTNCAYWISIAYVETREEVYFKSKEDWDRYWNLMGIVPSRSLRVTVA